MSELYKHYKGIHHEINTNATAICRACRHGNLKNLKELVAGGADVNERTQSERETPLMLASKYGHVSLVDFLIKMGAQVNYVDSLGRTALMFACRLGEWKCARSLLYSWQVDIDKMDNGGNTALTLTASHLSSTDHLTCIEFLLEQDADVNIKNNIGMTPIMYCTKSNAVGWEGVKMLLNAGADPDAVNDVGENLLMQAASQGHSEILQWLMDIGICNLNPTSLYGDNALILALKTGNTQCIGKLLQVGSNPNSISGQGCHALSIAASLSFEATLLLLTYGAVPQPSRLYVRNELFTDQSEDVKNAIMHCPELFQATDIAVLHRTFSAANLLSTVSSCYPLYPVYSVPQTKAPCKSTDLVLQCIHEAAHSCPAWVEMCHDFSPGPSTLLFLCQQVVSTMAGFSKKRHERLENCGLPPKLVRNILLEGLKESMFMLPVIDFAECSYK